jgi:hypothetical protein
LALSSLAFHSGDLARDAAMGTFRDVTAALAALHCYLLLTLLLWASMIRRFEAEKGPPPLRVRE